ncbi:MAG TPA: phage/plasmid primase, P4 family [Terriglobales bacterium]|jgi:putative DNA primase/helicase|nr:phage/plasmid primase, P4 family [Terriglobales bacterium]
MSENNVPSSNDGVKPKEKKKTFPRTDSGNAELFSQHYQEKLRYDHKHERWLTWREHWWAEDGVESVVQMAKNAARLRLQASVNFGDDESRKKEQEWAKSSESRAKIEAVLKLARSERLLADPGSDWDSEAYLLGVMNGVVDLKAGQLRAGKQSDKITLHTDVAFDPEAKAPRWEQFIDEIFQGDDELIDYIHRAAGYAITGATNEQCLFLCPGLGSNGKSTFLQTIHSALGDYARNLPFSAFELRSRAAIPSEIAGLVGRRFVTAIETDESAALNEARIKALTGCDPITARFLYGEWFTFSPVAKFWLAFNNKPQVTDDSHGFWRRVRLIPFDRQFRPEEADQTLLATLRAELLGVLAWLVRGCLKWQAEGLEPPQRVQDNTEAYRVDSDPLADYLAEKCVFDPSARIDTGTLYIDYTEWAKANGEVILSKNAFSRRLQARGLKKIRAGHYRTWTWLGICRGIDVSAQKLKVAS